MARGSLYGALVLVIGGMVIGAALINQPQTPPSPHPFPTADLPAAILTTAVIPTVVLPTVQIGQLTATPVIKDFGSFRIEYTEFGELLLYEEPQTTQAEIATNALSCPHAGCALVARIAQGEMFITDGVIDGEELEPGQKIWRRTWIGDQRAYIYAGSVVPKSQD